MKRSLNDTVISVRCTKRDRREFRRAAKAARQTLSTFMVEAARGTVEEALQARNGAPSVAGEQSCSRGASSEGEPVVAAPALVPLEDDLRC